MSYSCIHFSVEVKERYKRSCQKHEIHCVDNNNRIVLKEVDLSDFAVKLKISHELPTTDNFRDERRQHFENLQDVKEDNISISKLTDDEHHVTFIRGIAGMGKSVLAKQLTYGWATGEMYKKFKMCVMFECRDLNYFKDHDGAELKKHRILDEFLKSKVSYDLGDGDRVLFIVDGLDELYDITEKDSIIFDLLNIKGKYGMAKVIITGRPHVEYKLKGYCKNMGGMRKVEILGLRVEHIQEYINKFALIQEDISLANAAEKSSTRYLPILSVPQFLNTYCCILKSTMGAEIKDQSELYCWTIYLLLKQHASKQDTIDKKVSQIFQDFSQTIVALSKVCHNLLTDNKIVFEGNAESLFGVIGQEKEFVDSLFVDVSDNIKEKYQFKHLSLMEFLSALHVCRQDTTNRMKLIKDDMEKGFIEVVSFVCRLMSRFSSEGIIKEILRNAARLEEEVNDKQLLTEVLELLNECGLDDDTKLSRSFEIITYFMNDNFKDKEFILAVVRQCSSDHFDSFESTSDSISKICFHLEKCGCEEADIRAAFGHVRFGDLYVSNIEMLKCAVKYLRIDYRIWLHYMKTTVKAIRRPLSEYCGGVWIGGCEFEDEEIESRILGGKLEELHIFGCSLNTRQSFVNLCCWGITCGRYGLYDLEIKEEFWGILVEAIEKRRAAGELKLKALDIGYCTSTMCDRMKIRVRRSDNYLFYN